MRLLLLEPQRRLRNLEDACRRRSSAAGNKTGGFEARESKDGKWLYFSRPPYSLAGRGGKSSIWRKPLEGGAETLVLDNETERLWTLADEYLYFVDVEAEPHATLN